MSKEKKKQYEGIVTLGLGHSMLANSPGIPEIGNPMERMEQFGLFGLQTEGLQETPVEVDSNDKYKEFIFRGLSETIVRKSFDPIDFSMGGVLKKSTPLIVGQTIYTNHYSYIGNQVGVVYNAYWDKGYNQNGIIVPAGINLKMRLDYKNNQKLVDSMLMDPPAVHSNSVTVRFSWVQSEPDMEYRDFRDQVGGYNSKGELIRRICTDIKAYTETSLVSHGADPYAKVVGPDGKIVNSHISQAMDSFNLENPKSPTSYHFMSFKGGIDGTQEQFSIEETNKLETNNNKHPFSMKFTKALVVHFAALMAYTITEEQRGLEEDQFQEQFDFEAFETAMNAEDNVLLTLALPTEGGDDNTAEVERLTQEVTDLTQQLVEAKKATPGAETLSELTDIRADEVAEIERLYNLTKGVAPSESLKETWNKSNIASLKVLRDTYNEQLETKFPISCKDCNSTNVSRATTQNLSNPTKKEVTSTTEFSKESAAEKIERLRNR